MYNIEEFDEQKTKVLKYILFKKRTEQEVRNKFSKTISEELLNDIIDYFGDEIRFYPNDILQLVDIIVQKKWVPDVLIFQYVFSDMYKYSDEKQIVQFIDKLASFLNSYNQEPIYILCNDINLSKSMGGGRRLIDINHVTVHE